MKKIIIANWKSNPDTVNEAITLATHAEQAARSVRNVEVVIAAPFPFLVPLVRALKRVRLAAQDTFWAGGPYTGEVSWRQLKNLGIAYSVVGHSSRRIYAGETNAMINKKVTALLEHGMTAILCVGESEREGNEVPAVVGEQLTAALAGVKKTLVKNLIVTYEPVWAISTQPDAHPDTPDNAFRALVYIRKVLSDLYGRKIADSVLIIYGGSVNPGNVKGFLTEGNMAGALVGGASLKPHEFEEIIRIAARS